MRRSRHSGYVVVYARDGHAQTTADTDNGQRATVNEPPNRACRNAAELARNFVEGPKQ